MADLTVGSLCSGILGLDLAVERHYGAELAWCAEINPAASRVIAARTDVTNYGDFRDVTPPAVDILCAGFPCQPVSAAGKRAGIDDERWLFDDICDLLGRLDPPPRLLVFENVRGLLTANGGDAMARVVEGLARCGYVGSWRTVRASDVGAPHRRERVFIVAVPDSLCGGHASLSSSSSSTDSTRKPGGPADRGGTVADADDVGRERDRDSWHGGIGSTDDRFGPYGAAVERWASVIGRPAPLPTDSRQRLAPRFVEWMMGYPEGWATDVLSNRSDALRCLGNAVVPQQAALALSLLDEVR